MESNPLLQQIAKMKQSFLDEEIIDAKFIEMESLASDGDPNFAQDTINSYFEKTNNILPTAEEEIAKTPVDQTMLVTFFHNLKGLCSSVGANKVKIEVEATRACCHQGNMEGAKAAFERLKRENETLKAKLDSYFQLVKQAKEESAQMVKDAK